MKKAREWNVHIIYTVPEGNLVSCGGKTCFYCYQNPIVHVRECKPAKAERVGDGHGGYVDELYPRQPVGRAKGAR